MVLGTVAQVTAHVRKTKESKSSPTFETEEELKPFLRAGRWVSLGNFAKFNWATTVMAMFVLWSFIIAALVKTDETLQEFGVWQSWIAQNFTWLYIGSQNVWAIMLVWLAFSRFGSLKLGKADEKPAYGDIAWFAMLFCCGIGVGIYYWGVSEPMYYYRAGYSNALWRTPINNDDDRAQQAIFMTLFHWGLHGFVVYVVVALALGVVAYRWDMPLTMRSAFYPLLGDLIYSTIGDIIDALSISCTTFGVCTSLGFGVSSINSILHRLDSDFAANDRDLQIGIIWIITILATISICLGLDRGIQTLSIVTFVIGVILCVALLLMDNTWFLLNSYVQSVGHYVQWVIQVGFQCDSWQQLGYEFDEAGGSNRLWGSESHLVSRVTEALGHGLGSQSEYYGSHAKQFEEWWTVFYWGWWISWAPFVGMFIARVSRGRTIRQVIFGAFLGPTLFCFAWLVIFGSLGIKMERVAELALGVKPDVMDGSVDCAAMGYEGGVPTSDEAIALAGQGYYALACRPHGERLLDVLSPYTHFSKFFFVLALVGVTLYFITSSDSGSYIDDILASQGLANPPIVQKIVWAFTEGACATALLVEGGSSALSALQAVSICAGLPYTFAICFLCTSLYRALKIDQDEADICDAPEFNTGIFDFADIFMSTNPAVKPRHNVAERFASLLVALVAPFIPIFTISCKLYKDNVPLQIVSGVVGLTWFLAWIGLLLASVEHYNFAYMGWTCYIMMVFQIMHLRASVRENFKIYGGIAEDFFCALTMYPFALSQLDLHLSSAESAMPNVI